MVRHCLWKMSATLAALVACIKPGLVRRPLCHKVNLPTCVARRPFCQKVNLPLPVIASVKQNVLFARQTHSGQCLLRLQTLDTEPYNIFSNLLIMIHSLNRSFAVRNPMPYSYLIYIATTSPPQLLPVSPTNILNALS